MLDRFSLQPGLHMVDFGKHGKFAKMPIDIRENYLHESN